MKTTLHEDDIIRSKDAELPEDDWPEFTLTQCQIIDPQEGTYVSLFKADTNNPLAISGRLEPVLREYASLLSNRHSLPQYIELTAVRTYAYGQDENGEIALWAAGKCGWYLLRPSRSYKKTYSSTLEAVKALYFVTDFHVETRTKVRKSRDVSILQLFRAYAQEPIHQCIDADSAQAIYEGHAEFLTKAMEKEDIKAAVRWLSTPIYQHLKDIVVETFDNDKEEQELVSSGRPPTHGSLRPRGAEFSMKAKGRRNSEKMSHEHTAGVKRKKSHFYSRAKRQKR